MSCQKLYQAEFYYAADVEVFYADDDREAIDRADEKGAMNNDSVVSMFEVDRDGEIIRTVFSR